MKMRMPEIYYEVKKFLKHKNEMDALYQEQLVRNKGKQIQYWNWWDDERTAYWLERFMESRELLKNTDMTIALCSVFGEREVLERVNADVRIFFSGENLHNPRHAQYADYMLSGKNPFDFAMGFDEFEDNRYMRFPLWLTYMFAPDSTEEDIRKRCAELRKPLTEKRDKFCAMIARADWSGLRTEIYETMNKIGQVDCPSALLHNDDSLLEVYSDDKIAYLRQYQFNICPENTNAMGYTTEKLFESINAGCVPIYWGSNNQPEPDILNPEAIIFWDVLKKSGTSLDEKKLASLPRLLSGAEEIVVRKFEDLENKLRRLIKS